MKVAEGYRGDEDVMGRFGVQDRSTEGPMVADFENASYHMTSLVEVREGNGRKSCCGVEVPVPLLEPLRGP